MTIREKFLADLEGHGLWPNEAKAVMDIVEAEKHTQGVKWNDDITAYPTSMLAALRMNIWTAAADYLKKTAPMHFALPIFDVEHPDHKLVAGS